MKFCTLLSLFITSLLWAPTLLASSVPRCFDLMAVGFPLLPELNDSSRNARFTFFTKDYAGRSYGERKTTAELIKELRIQVVSSLHHFEAMRVKIRTVQDGKNHINAGSFEATIKTENVEFDSTGLWRRNLFRGPTLIVSYEDLYYQKGELELLNFRHYFSFEQAPEFKARNHDERIWNLMTLGPFKFVDLNLKNETPDSVRGFFYHFAVGQVFFRRGGVMRSIKAKKEQIEVARNGDFFVNREFLFNLYAISSEASSFFHLQVMPTKPSKDTYIFVVDDVVRGR